MLRFTSLKPATLITQYGLRASSNSKPLDYFHTNTVAVADMGSRLRERKWLERFIHISSAEIYGTCEGAIPETAPLRPSTPYAVSKAAGDQYLTTLWKNFGFPMNLVYADVEGHIGWADLIFVMEKQHKSKLSAQFKAQLQGKKVVCLNIPDNYKFMEPALIKLLESKVTPFLHSASIG